MIPQNRHRLLLIVAPLVVLYSLAVLWRVASITNLRIYCLIADGRPGELGAKIDHVELDSASPDEPTWRGERKPARGDIVVGLAGAEIHGFHDYAAAVNQLAEAKGMVTIGPRADVSEDPDVQKKRRESPADTVQVVDQESLHPAGSPIRWAPMLLRTPGGPPDAPPVETWIRLQRTPPAEMLLSGGWFLVKMMIFSLGAFAVWRRPDDAAASMFFTFSACAVVAYMGGFHWSNLVGNAGLIYPFVICAMLLPAVNLHFYLCFPHPWAAYRRRPWTTLAIVYGLPVVWLLVMIGALIDATWSRADDAATRTALEWIGLLTILYVPVAALWFLAGLGVLLYRFLYSAVEDDRQQIKWVLTAACAALVPITVVIYQASLDTTIIAYGTTVKLLMLSISLMLAATYAACITRGKLMRGGRILNRWLVHLGISTAVTGLFGIGMAVWTMLGGGDRLLWGDAAVVGLAVLLVLAVVGWWSDHVQRASELRFHREKYQLDRALRRLGDAVDQLVEPRQLVAQMLQSAAAAVSAEGGAVYLRLDGNRDFTLAASLGQASAPPSLSADSSLVRELEEESLQIVAPQRARTAAGAALARPLAETASTLACGLENQGMLVGLVLLSSKEDGAAYTDEDRTFLLALARTTGLALLSAQGRHVIEQLRTDLEGKLQEIAEQRRRINLLQGELLEQERIRMSDPDPEPTPALLPQDARVADLRHSLRGSSPAVRELLNSVAKIARSGSSVLIRGESGTGKELLARAIHDNSPRADGPFVVVHCAALSQGLLESELFGHERGAFTGADRRKIGRFELADRGTLFLDEIGDVNLDTQIKLLRVLQEHTIERVGGVETIRVDVRLVAATHRNLEQLMAEAAFREDLFYRLNVISLHAPPLRERGRDVLELARHFLADSRERAGKAVNGFSSDTEAALLAYPWPGNVRQLQNVIERAVVLAERETLQLIDLPPEIRDASTAPLRRAPNGERAPARESFHALLSGSRSPAEIDSSGAGRGLARRDGKDSRSPNASASGSGAASVGSAPSASAASGALPALGDSLQELERRRLVEALAACDGNKAEAARLLGLPRSTLFSKLKKYGLE